MESMDKKLALKALIEKGKSVGKLTTQEIDNAIIELDIDICLVLCSIGRIYGLVAYDTTN